MVRKKNAPAKNSGKEEEANIKSKLKQTTSLPLPSKENIPAIIEQEFRRAQHRFLFNIDQIEKKYCQSSSGLVLNLRTEEYEFDEELCTAESDEELIGLIKRQTKSLEGPIGAALLSTPAPDPDERNEEQIKQWEQLNEIFEAEYEKRLKEEEVKKKKKEKDDKENEHRLRRCTSLVLYAEKPAAPIIQPKIDLRIFFIEMMEHLNHVGASAQNHLSALFNSNQKIQINQPTPSKRRFLIIEADEGENEQRKRRKLQHSDGDDHAGPSTSGTDYMAPKIETSPQLALVPFHAIPQTPLPKIAECAERGNKRRGGKTIRISTNDEVVEQTPPEEWRRTTVPLIVHELAFATPKHLFDDSVGSTKSGRTPIVTTPGTGELLEQINLIEARTMEAARDESVYGQFATANEKLGKAIGQIEEIMEENGEEFGQHPMVKGVLKRMNSRMHTMANQAAVDSWLRRRNNH